MTLSKEAEEKDLEAALLDHIRKFLLELGIVAEYALRDISKPLGISEFHYLEKLPDDLKGTLPTIEEIQAELTEGSAEADELKKKSPGGFK